jgi:hypothetical protein
VVTTTSRPLYPGKDPVPIVQEAGWAPGPVWTCAKNLAATGIRSPDRSARSQSLYRLNYPAQNTKLEKIIKNTHLSQTLAAVSVIIHRFVLVPFAKC